MVCFDTRQYVGGAFNAFLFQVVSQNVVLYCPVNHNFLLILLATLTYESP